jgi:hypothetical protein
VGLHGETVRGLLQPGEHARHRAGVEARLRAAERVAYRTRDWQAARLYRQALEGIESAVRRFVERELVALVGQSTSWRGAALEGVAPGALKERGQGKLGVGQVRLAVNRIAFELTHADHPAQPMQLEWQRRGHCLVAGIRDPGWLGLVSAEQRRALATGLASLYKLAGIDVVREQVRAHLPANVGSFDVADGELIVWQSDESRPVVYRLGEGPSEPHTPEGALRTDWPVLAPQQLIFARTPLAYELWVQTWLKDQGGQGHPGLPGLGEDLLPVGEPPTAPPHEARRKH